MAHESSRGEADPLMQQALERVGRVLCQKWRLDALLGVGGMAAVYAATHRNGNRVAIKMLHPHLSLDPFVRERFLREGYVANSVGHDGAVTVLDDDFDEFGAAFLVMELLQGETLDARWERNGPLPVEDVVSVSVAVLEVLAAAHAKGIVHRDLKPENIFVTYGGVVKILDFGIARLLELSGSASATKTGSMLGTPAFMPPEQALGLVADVDYRSDLWAVGALMFALLSGELVHPGRTANEQLVSAATRPARSLEAVCCHVPGELAKIVNRALAFDKEQRWPDARSMRDVLAHFATADRQRIADGNQQAPCDAVSGPGPVAAAPVPNAVPTGARREPGSIGTGTVTAQAGDIPIGGTVAWNKPTIPATGSGMAVGRTVPGGATRGKKALLAVVGGVAGLLLSIGAGAVLMLAGRGETDDGGEESSDAAYPVTPPVASAKSTSATTAIAPEAVASSESEHVSAPVQQISGTVSIVAIGGVCVVAIDEVSLGTTPIEAHSLAPGSHEVRCSARGGVLKRDVQVKSGEALKISFTVRAMTPPKSVNPLDIR